MHTADLIARVESLANRLEALYEELDQLVVDARPSIAAEATTWIEREVERRIELHAAAFLELGVDRVHQMKAAVTGLLEGLPSSVEAETANPERWPHRGGGRALFTACFRSVISRVGEILHDYRLVGDAPDVAAPTWEAPERGGTWRYMLDTGFEERAHPPIARYWELSRELDGVMRDFEAAQRALTRARARELWESL